MFSKFILSALALAATASALPGGGSGSPSQCTTSTRQCCQNVQNSSNLDSTVIGILTGLLGVDASGLNVPVGTGCTPIDILGGVSCNQNTVCCGDVYAPQLISVNCVPVTLNL